MEDNDEKIRIEKILGISVTSNAHFAVNNGIIAYPAGSTVVLKDLESGNLLSHVVLENRKPISSLQLKDESLLFVATEDSSYLRVIDWKSGLIKDISPCQNIICCAVSSQHGILVVVGSDRVVSVWDYKGLLAESSAGTRAKKIASSSVACNVSCVSFSPDGNFFVTGGHRHLKFWYLQFGKNESLITGRPAILGSEHSNSNFADIITDGVFTYAISNFDNGNTSTIDISKNHLCQFDERRFLDKWVGLKTKQSYCMTLESDLIFIGCADGIIRCFRVGKLDFVATLPLPHHLGVDVAKATDISALSTHPPVSKFPSVVAIGSAGKGKIVAVYADHSLYVWDVHDIKRVGLSHSWLWHSGCIWDCAIAKTDLFLNKNGAESDSSAYYNWPLFVTCCSDDTFRTWDITAQSKTNLYSNECLDIKYISTRYLDSPIFISHGNGIRCVGIGANFSCCGDRQGNLRLCKDKTKNELIKIKAHKEEVLSIDVRGSLIATASRDGSINIYNIGNEIEKLAQLQEHTGSVTSVKFLMTERNDAPFLQIISCGADKNLIIRKIKSKKKEFDKNNDDIINGNIPQFLLDNGDFVEEIEVEVTNVVSCKTPLFDLEIDTSGKHALVACQDSCIRIFNITTGKQSKTLRSQSNNANNMGTIIKIALDPSGYYVAGSSTDKTIIIFDYYKGDVVAKLMGHSELATAIRFTPDFQSLITVGGDSCIIVWTLTREMIITMETRMKEKRSRHLSKISHSPVVTPLPTHTIISTPTPTPPPQIPQQPPQKSILKDTKATTSNVSQQQQHQQLQQQPPSPSPSPIRSEFRFNIGNLPDWAKKQIKGESSTSSSSDAAKKSAVTLPQGKWSERVEQASGAMTIKSFYNSDTVVSVPFSNKQSSSSSSSNNQKDHIISIKKENSFVKENNTSSLNEEKDSRDNSFEACLSSKDHEGDDEGCSTDFYSDVNKSTDGEEMLVSSRNANRQYTRIIRSDRDTDDTDESSSTRNTPTKRKGILKKSSGEEHPYEIIRSRNAELIMSVKAKNREISKSRLELEKRLDETRKKLQSIGYKSMSQSTQDLSTRSHGVDGRKEFLDDDESEDESRKENGTSAIRRACSLSDLNDLNILPESPSNVVANQNSSNNANNNSRRKRSFHKHRNEKSRNNSNVFDPQNILTRSTSVSALMTQLQQSDSEPESLPVTPSYMSKTISSQGKTKKKPSNVVSSWSQSNENLLRDGNEGRLRVSSSEQNLSRIGGFKPTPMPRNKMSSSHVKKPQQVHGAKGLAVVQGVRQGSSEDFEEPQMSTALASTSVDILRKSLDNVIFLRNRVKSEVDVTDQVSINRILEDGLLGVQRQIQECFYDTRPKIITEHEPTVL